MNARRKGPRVEAAEPEDRLLREILGYLNFSGGKPDAAFQRNWNSLYVRPEYLESDTALPEYLGRELVRLQPGVPALRVADPDAHNVEAEVVAQPLGLAAREHIL